MKTIFKTDLDVKLNKKEMELWIETRKLILKHLGFKVEKVIVRNSSRGHHFWWHVKGKKLKAQEINFIQLLLGDDMGRYYINKRRIERGVKNWNKLFSEVLWKRKILPLVFVCGDGSILNFKKLKAYVRL